MAYRKLMPGFQDIVNKKQKGTTIVKQDSMTGAEQRQQSFLLSEKLQKKLKQNFPCKARETGAEI